MSLDVYLTLKEPVKKRGTSVFVRENGSPGELTPEEVAARWPDAEVEEQEHETTDAYHSNITHNLGKMANEAGIYYALWRPEEKGWKYAKDIIEPLEKGLEDLKARPDYYKQFGNYPLAVGKRDV